jgi:hypothetical protein
MRRRRSGLEVIAANHRDRVTSMPSKLLITIGTLIYGIAPLYADLNITHVFHPEWTPHAKFHTVWLLSTNTSIAILSLWLLCARSQTILAGVLGLCVIGGFWIAAVTRSLYGGTFTDVHGIDTTVFGLDGNAFTFSLVLAILAVGIILKVRSDEA